MLALDKVSVLVFTNKCRVFYGSFYNEIIVFASKVVKYVLTQTFFSEVTDKIQLALGFLIQI